MERKLESSDQEIENLTILKTSLVRLCALVVMKTLDL